MDIKMVDMTDEELRRAARNLDAAKEERQLYPAGAESPADFMEAGRMPVCKLDPQREPRLV